ARAHRALFSDPADVETTLRMADLFKNARSALQDFFQGRRRQSSDEPKSTAHVAAPAAPSPLAGEIATAFESRDGSKLLDLLRPRPGLSSALRELHRAGRLAGLFPERELSHAITAIERLEQLESQTSINAERFGTMLHELEAPALLSLTLLLHD